MKKKNNQSGLVYSTDPNFRLPGDEDVNEENIKPNQQDLRIWLEKNHRGGKEVTIIKNFIGLESEMEKLCKTLKTKCGTGGTVKNGEIIIQGDHRKKISELLAKEGFRSKLAGG